MHNSVDNVSSGTLVIVNHYSRDIDSSVLHSHVVLSVFGLHVSQMKNENGISFI